MAASTCFAVLGGHRSGTSLVAGILYNLGLFMGTRMLGPSPGNRLGHFEDIEFVILHRAMIGDWRRPALNVEPKMMQDYSALVQKREKLPRWGLKDPRLCFTFPCLMLALNRSTALRVIRVVRDPNKSAASLVARSTKQPGRKDLRVTPGEAAQIVQAYDGALIAALDDFTGDVLTVEYDALVDDALGGVRKMADFIGTTPTEQAVAFVKPWLRHQ